MKESFESPVGCPPAESLTPNSSMRRTPWASAVPSDRIPPSRSPTPNRNKGKAKDSGPPKSKEVQKLETFLKGLENGAVTQKDPNGVCFCQARSHPLSTYTPLCMKCGFIPCSLHVPAYPCPHCLNPLVSGPSHDALIAKIKQEIFDTLQREEEERERERVEREKAAGAFPTLASATGSPEPPKPNQPRTVLSLNQKTRKVTVASYTSATPVPQRQEVVLRVPPPPLAADYVKGKVAEDGRRWQNFKGENLLYIPAVQEKKPSAGIQGGRRRKKAKGDGHDPT